MGKRLKSAGKGAVFLCVLCICIRFVWQVIVPKFFFNSVWPTTSAYLGFYRMEENTVDVLFFGSSHAASFFLPQELYDSSGITGYNLGCEQQNLVTSYFWLKEALRFQKPKVVVLDCYMLFPYNPQEPLNTAESCTRKAMDYMKWSSVKREAVSTICRLDENQSLVSYYFPNIRYHTRWTGLSEDDFSFSQMAVHGELKGYAPQASYGGRENFVPFEKKTAVQEADMVPLMREYLDYIEELCRKEGIRLVLVKTPTTAQDAAKSLSIQNYTDRHELKFLDFNEKGLYQKTGLDFRTDNCDDGHGSIWGAQKVTRQIGEALTDWYGLGGHADAQWEKTRAYYEGIKKDCGLPHFTSVKPYTAALRDERYSIFISAKDECTTNLEDSVIENLKNIGLQAALQGEYGCSYLAVVSGGEIVEQIGYSELKAEGTVRDGRVKYEIVSAGNGCGNISSIKIDGNEYSKNGRGLNIVVYNNETKKIVDSVCFDAYEESSIAIR